MSARPPVPTGSESAPFAGEAARWAAVGTRDRSADGAFVYAVTSTGVYCRPSCPSRSARRAHVRFFDHPEAAEAAGFRACRRCVPDGEAPAQRRARLVAEACRKIDAAPSPPALDDLAVAAGLSRWHFQRAFKTVTGLTPAQYARARRGERVRTELAAGRAVTESVYAAGYHASSRFYAEAGQRLGMKPQVYRRGGTGERIRFAVGECSLGSVLVASTDTGVCAILLGNAPEPLPRELQDLFPHAELVGADATYEATVARAIGLIDDPGTPCTLPLDIRGTAFQQKVWQALRALPPGATLSYAELAERIGAPGAARAVAGACARNRIAVPSPATAWSVPTARSPATAGGWSASARCSIASAGSAREPLIKPEFPHTMDAPRIKQASV